jgi:molecular chaperone GrpE
MPMNPGNHREGDILHQNEIETSSPEELRSQGGIEALAQGAEDNIEAKLKELEEQVNKNYDLYLRTYAEMENLKKRFQKEKEAYLKFGSEGLLRSLLVVLDNLEAAMEHLKKGSDLKAVEEGLMLTLKSFYEALEKAGVSRIEAKGKAFDPNLHEALMEKEHEGDSRVVLEELQKGYMLYDRLLRPSKVVISKSTEKKD